MFDSILIVDDDTGMREMLSSVLNDEGYSVEAVVNGKEAIKVCEKSSFDVALIDIKLPDMEGTELLTKLKKRQPSMIMIIITGHPSVENAMKAVNEKADGYLLKPFEMTSLLTMISRLLTEKTNDYLRVFGEAVRSKDSSPVFKDERPKTW
jgi:DNA-binding NtrC family response regulator